MSLIALTDRLYAGRSMARTLLLLIALTAAVIAGLLAMHSLNAHTAADTGHQTTLTAAAASTAVDDHHPGAPATDEPCPDCGTGHTDMLTMACVLALLAAVLLLFGPRNALRCLSTQPRPRPLGTAVFPFTLLRPPSLNVLCISRT
ncbi:DUF6153 family protein [Microbacterium invictum]|uniref:Uncharacterized protein n=1 Tax=Microbacterium invictum TaxID=515415 RepID=A0AA40VMY6_9MICO|nr:MULTISPECIES: DUF6153 family protein [Microbacterium]MBB4140327.1 hypothetical protein [Microbacterium invictum]